MKFIHQAANDCSVDAQWELHTDDGTDTGLAIQDCSSYGGGYVVNEYEMDSEGNVVAVSQIATWAKLSNAKRMVRGLAESRGIK